MSNEAGYVKLWRSILEWEWYHDDRCVRLLIHLLVKSNYTDRRWKGQQLKPGQLITSSISLAEQLGWSRSAVNRTLDKLKSSKEVDTESDNRWTLVTLRKWVQLQDDVSKSDTKPDSQRTTGDTASGQRVTQPADTDKEGKKGRREEGKNSPLRTPIGVQAVAEIPFEGSGNGTKPPPVSPPPPPRTDKRDPSVQGVIDYLTAKLIAKDIAPSLDPTVKANRYAAASLIKKLAKDYPTFDPLESAKRLIDFATSDQFHHRNCTHVSYLFNNLGKIAADAKAKRNDPKTQTDADRKQQLQDALDKRFAERRAAATSA